MMNVKTHKISTLLSRHALKLTKGVMLLTCSSMALADNDSVKKDTTWYVGTVIGTVIGNSSNRQSETEVTNELLTSSTVTVTNLAVDDSRIGWKLNVGFDLTENVAIEAGYMDFNDVNVELNPVVSDPGNYFNTAKKIHPNSTEGFTVGSVYHYDLSDNFGLTGSIGLYNWEGDFNTQPLNGIQSISTDADSGTDVYFGLGGGYQLAEDVTLKIEWEHYQLDDDDAQMWSIGVNYHFK
jgi:opacity protein-like surface antigen